jgi:hypothetical protein
MKAGYNRDKIALALRILGIIILVIGLFVAVGQVLSIGNGANSNNQIELLSSLGYIAVGMAIEFLGIGLIIFGNRK